MKYKLFINLRFYIIKIKTPHYIFKAIQHHHQLAYLNIVKIKIKTINFFIYFINKYYLYT